MFVTRCVVPLAVVASLVACDRSNDSLKEPPRRTTVDAMPDLVSSGDGTTTGGDEDSVDDFVGAPYYGYDSFYDEDLAWSDSDGETDGDANAWADEGWCEGPVDPVCEYEYGLEE